METLRKPLPLVMGILNVTPDSFFDGGRCLDEKTVAGRCETILSEGGSWIDVGGCSTRPGGAAVTFDEEWRRVSMALAVVRKHFPDAHVSVDTFRSEIARRAVSWYGVGLVNDISGGSLDSGMFAVVAETGAAYVLSHHPSAEDAREAAVRPIEERLSGYFERRTALLRQMGVRQVWLDPGIGFGKTLAENYRLVARLDRLAAGGNPVLVGVSRKSLIYKLLGTSPDGALPGTLALETLSLLRGASMLRVHDVKAAVDCIRITHAFLSSTGDADSIEAS